MRYTELTCIPYWASKTDIVGQVLGPSVCVCVCGYRCVHACMHVDWYTELTCIPYWAFRTEFNGHCGSGPVGGGGGGRDFLNDNLPSQVLLLCTD